MLFRFCETSKTFYCLQRVPPSFVLIFRNKWMLKNFKRPPFEIFWHYETVQISHFYKKPKVLRAERELLGVFGTVRFIGGIF